MFGKQKINFNKDHIIEGRYKDTIYYKDGTIIKNEQKKNVIVNTAGDIMAALFLGQSELSSNFGNIHYAVGNGDPNWDTLIDKGKSNQVPTVTQLVNEVGRILPTEKYFIDDWEGNPVSPGYSNFVRLLYEMDENFVTDEFLREFGLYLLGDSNLNSGYLFDYVVHASFQKTSDIYLFQREFEIKF